MENTDCGLDYGTGFKVRDAHTPKKLWQSIPVPCHGRSSSQWLSAPALSLFL